MALSEGMKKWLARRAFGHRTRMRFWRKMAVQVHNSLPVYTAIEACLKTARRDKSPLALVYERALRGRDGGGLLGDAMEGYATREEIQLLRAGEKAGDIEMGFNLCRDLLANKGIISKEVKGNLAYPCFLLTICIAMMIMVSRMIIPQLGLVYDPQEWTGAAALLRDMANFVNSWKGPTALGTFFFLLALMFWSFPRWTGKTRKAIDDVGPYGIYKTMTGSSWMFSMAVLMRSGMQIRAIFEQTLRDPMTSPWLRERVQAVSRQYAWGKNFGESLYSAGYKFPSKDAVDDMLAYAQLPNMEEHMFDIAKDQMELDIESIRKRMKNLNIFLLFVVFGLIGLTLYGVFSFQQQFSATM